MIASNSKGQTLFLLKNKISQFRVPELLVFTVASFVSEPEQTVYNITKYFNCRFLVIRSSAADEDGTQNARAGEYDSVLNVPSTDS